MQTRSLLPGWLGVGEALRQALAEPIGREPLRDLSGARIVLAVDDVSRRRNVCASCHDTFSTGWSAFFTREGLDPITACHWAWVTSYLPR